MSRGSLPFPPFTGSLLPRKDEGRGLMGPGKKAGHQSVTWYLLEANHPPGAGGIASEVPPRELSGCPRGLQTGRHLVSSESWKHSVQRGLSTQPQAAVFLELVKTKGSRKAWLGLMGSQMSAENKFR